MSSIDPEEKKRDELLEQILAETAKRPYVPRRPVRPKNSVTKKTEHGEYPQKNNTEREQGIPETRAIATATKKNVGTSARSDTSEIRSAKPQQAFPNTVRTDNYEEQEYKDVSGRSHLVLDYILSFIEMSIIIVLVVSMIFSYVIHISVVDGNSMTPTLENGDRLIIRSLGYSPENGDIVVINNKEAHLISDDGKVVRTDGINMIIVKRVIAVGGQTVDIDFESGSVFVDGNLLDEKYISEPTTRDEFAFEYPLTVPEGYIFVMGDNRNISKDSRHPDIGLVDEKSIIGQAVFRIYPLKKFGGLD